ncbi:MAG: alanine--tRNA ligase [Actinobacteria bacterium]|nr:alanine--tRNA ligase [Actinomycetota bacterium]MDA3016438.1 alanine--tRNA ligase [Actinomycetota bacterium]
MVAEIRTANELRRSFTGFFEQRGHTKVESASLIPHDPSMLFTFAGMVPFKPYFVGDEVAPFKRAVSVQKCARAGGKHNDLDDVGRTKRHCVFFEMLGNFSFGDYFKTDAIPWSWELVTEVFGFDGDQLWITVHESDDEAEQIWHDQVGVPMNRIQRLGDADNFWQMGETGPCGPCSEIHIDRGAAFGPDGGPKNDPKGDRFLEFWNLVFMQFNQDKDGTRMPLPKPSIDTGAGLERILALKQGKDSIWETDVLYPLIEQAQSATSKKYIVGDYEDRSSFSLRVLAEHARSSTMLVNDGVFPSNEGRGYVLRRIFRRAVRHAYLLGTDKLVMPKLVETAIEVMREAHPSLLENKDFILGVLTKEEESFRQTLKNGLSILEDEFSSMKKSKKKSTLSGKSAFVLHDTYGFPLELTQEIAGERSIEVDVAAFEIEMNEQRTRAKSARKGSSGVDEMLVQYRQVLEQHGQTKFVGYESAKCEAKVLAINPIDDSQVEVFLDTTPFYAESGGQVGDHGVIRGSSGEIRVSDAVFALPGLRRHIGVLSGEIAVGAKVTATIDSGLRNATRKNHTATHILHYALREVLGEHVKQAGSMVSAERLRFDFSHYAQLTPAEIEQIERIANAQVLNNSAVKNYETSKDKATQAGAIAFFGDKYGDVVRVLEAGDSIELCGGTHVAATGDIGLIKVVEESSIGSNLRRIEAVTGQNAVDYVLESARTMRKLSEVLDTSSTLLVDAATRKMAEIKQLNDELKIIRSAAARGRAAELIGKAVDGVVVQRVDDMSPGDLRELAIAIRADGKIKAVVLGGVTPTGGVALVAATGSKVKTSAGELISEAAKMVGGGGGGKGDIATAGGKNAEALDQALQLALQASKKIA